MVADASVVLDYLLAAPGWEQIAARLHTTERLHAPQLLDVEIVQVLRRHCLHKSLDSKRASQALDDLAAFPVTRHPHQLYVPRIWELRNNITAYDAAYVVLAEALNVPLLTRDKRLASAAGHHARIELV